MQCSILHFKSCVLTMMMHSLQSNNDFTAPSPAKGSDLAGN